MNWQNHSDPSFLTYFLLKTMKRLVDLHINEGSLKDYPLNPMQHAYLKGKSTETALHDLVFKIDGSLCKKEFALGWITRRAIMVSVQLLIGG
jgi:hypothetical protein